jgi:hypothetical protein
VEETFHSQKARRFNEQTKQKLKRENKPRKNSNNVVSPMPSLSACRFPFTYTHGVEENFFSFVSSLLSSSSTSFPPRFIIFLTSDVRCSRRKVVTPTQVIRLGSRTFFFFLVLRTTKTDLPQSLFLYSVTHSESTHSSAYIKLEKKYKPSLTCHSPRSAFALSSFWIYLES